MGGEEFLMVCQNGSKDAQSVCLFAERLRRHIKMKTIVVNETPIRITISIGVAIKEASMTSDDQLVNAADKALYAAKNGGRDRVCLFLDNQLVDCDKWSATFS